MCRCLALTGPLLVLTAATASGQIPVVERPETDVLLFAVKLDQRFLSDALPAYQDRGDVLIPLGEMCRLLGLAITVDAAGGLASGFVIDERRLFSLDVSSGRVIVGGRPGTFDPPAIEVHLDDIYVAAALISEWLPIRLDVNLYDALITVRPREPLPLQLRLDRERRIEMSRGSQGPAPPPFPRLTLRYSLLDGPFIDQTLGYTRLPRVGGGSTNSVQHTSYATGDLLAMEASAFLGGTEQGLNDLRVSLGRKDPEGRLLGFLGARDVTAGEVFDPGLDLITQSRSGPGLLISNVPLLAPVQFDRQTFRGDLPPGWDAELYRNESLVAYAQSRPDGLYEFTDVPLLFGMNVFRIELYGPQGQRRTERRLSNVGQTLTPRGAVYYRLVGSDPGTRLVGRGPSEATPRASLDVSAGVTRNLSASASLVAVELQDGTHAYGKAGLRAFWGFLFANADLVADRSGGTAWQGTLQSRIRGFGVQVQRAELRRYISEWSLSQSHALMSRTTLRLDAAVPQTFLPRLPLLVEVWQDRLAGGLRVTRVQGQVSAYRRGLSVSNRTYWSRSNEAATRSTASGQLLVSQYLRLFSLRSDLGYDLRPAAEVTDVAFTAEARMRRGFLVSTGVNRFLRIGQTRVFAGASKLEGAIGWTARLEVSMPGGLGVGLFLSLGIGRDARDGSWHTQARPIAMSGGVSGRAFLDTNGDGVMDAGDEPIPGAGFLINGTGTVARTNAAGVAFIPNLTVHQDVGLSLAASTLEDPFWQPALEGVRVTPRPGKVAVVDFPVVVSGEITGTVYLRRQGSTHALGNVEVQLVDEHGAVIKRMNSAFDGFYDLTMVPPGRYQMRVAADVMTRMGATLTSVKDIAITTEGTIAEGVDLVLDGPATPGPVPPAPPTAPAVPPPAPVPGAGAPPPA